METVWENLEVRVEDLPRVQDVHYTLHPLRYRTLRYLIAFIWLVFLYFGTVALVLFSGSTAGLVAGGVSIFFTVVAVAGIAIGYKRRSYALRQNDITYRKGWLFYSTTTIPFNRIQHTEVSQGPLERKFRLCTLKIYTAGGSMSDLSVPGLEQEEAAQIRDFIAGKTASYA